MKRKRILFVAEAATLAHVARPLALSSALEASRFDLFFACASRCHWLLRDYPGQCLALDSMDSSHFIAALARGTPLYDAATLQRYVQDDLRLFEEVRPDVVVGDFRLSLSVSARLAGVPYVAIANGYWSPYWRPPHYPVPNLLLTRVLPLPVAERLFQLARPLAFALHSRPLNQVRRTYGLPSLGNDLRRIYTDADHVLYADVSELFPGISLPSQHHFIGPLLWSPPLPLPAWWEKLPSGRPLVYVTLGSSGQKLLLPLVLQALEVLDLAVVVSTAGNAVPASLPANVFAAPYLPGSEAARRAALVICNGGSPTSQQALAAGVPVIGVADNLDQFLNMGLLSRAGAGALIRVDRFDARQLTRLAAEFLSQGEHRAAALRLAEVFSQYHAGDRFRQVIRQLLGTG